MAETDLMQPYSTVDLTCEGFDFHLIHQRISKCSGRIELRAPDGTICVLITKCELDAMEHALEILSSTETVMEMKTELARLAAVSVMPA